MIRQRENSESIQKNEIKVFLNPTLFYISTSIWVLRTPNTGGNSIFSNFYLWKWEKNLLKLWIKQSTSVLVKTLKNVFFWSKFVTFLRFQLFCIKPPRTLNAGGNVQHISLWPFLKFPSSNVIKKLSNLT